MVRWHPATAPRNSSHRRRRIATDGRLHGGNELFLRGLEVPLHELPDPWAGGRKEAASAGLRVSVWVSRGMFETAQSAAATAGASASSGSCSCVRMNKSVGLDVIAERGRQRRRERGRRRGDRRVLGRARVSGRCVVTGPLEDEHVRAREAEHDQRGGGYARKARPRARRSLKDRERAGHFRRRLERLRAFIRQDLARRRRRADRERTPNRRTRRPEDGSRTPAGVRRQVGHRTTERRNCGRWSNPSRSDTPVLGRQRRVAQKTAEPLEETIPRARQT